MDGSNESKGIRADLNLVTILIIPLAVAINFIAGTLVGMLRLPIYMDSVGTLLIAMLGGPWAGCLTGVLSIGIMSVTDPEYIPYMLCSGAMGFVAGYMAKKGWCGSFKKLIVMSAAVILVSVITGLFVIIAVFGGFDSSGESLLAAALISAGIPFWASEIITSVVTEVPDKFLSILVPWLIIRRLPERYLYRFSNGPAFIASLREDKPTDTEKNK